MTARPFVEQWALPATFLMLAACALPPELSPPIDGAHDSLRHVIPVFYATDRSYEPGTAPARRYGTGRGDMSYGIVEVSIPPKHRAGELETPSLWHLEFRADPDRHIFVLSVSQASNATFFTKLRDSVAHSRDRSAFVFVHGYNTTFEEAAQRTAQLAYDLGFSGVPILYSWPSQGNPLKYIVDANNADWTVAHLEDFLGAVAARSGASTIHLIGHSMGNRVLLAALEGFARRVAVGEVKPFREVLLTAPDVDAAIFRERASRILSSAQHFTMYASKNDMALHASESLAAFPRAGDTRDGILVVNGVDTIDASAVDTSFVGHSYFADSTSVLGDIDDILRNDTPPDQRSHLQAAKAEAGRYWILNPAE